MPVSGTHRSIKALVVVHMAGENQSRSALLAAKGHVNVFLYDGGIVPDPDGIITAGHDNKTARTVAIRRDEPINAPGLSAMFRHIIANNRARGWRKLKRER